MTVASSYDVFWAFVMSYSIPYLIGTPGANLGAKVGFVFAGVCVTGLLFVYFFVPELSNRSLEEVDEMFAVSHRGLF
jgi:MFS transporter, SP family, sugar:H+ symporter